MDQLSRLVLFNTFGRFYYLGPVVLNLLPLECSQDCLLKGTSYKEDWIGPVADKFIKYETSDC